MFGSFIIELVLGLCFLFAVLGLVTTAVTEALLARAKTRGQHLRRWLDQWTSGALAGAVSSDSLLSHPLLSASRPGTAADAMPSYLPATRLASALLERLNLALGPTLLGKDVPAAAAALRAELQALPNVALKTALSPLLDLAAARSHHGADLVQHFTTEVATWIDESMGRVEGWTRRHAKKVSLVVALVICFGFNVSAYEVLRHLSADPALRSALATAAVSFAPVDCSRIEDPGTRLVCQRDNARRAADAMKAGGSLSALGIGWDPAPRFMRAWELASPRLAALEAALWLFGVVVAAWAASLGGDFWFKWIAQIVRLTGAKPGSPSLPSLPGLPGAASPPGPK